ncbi:MAG TPA: hypothetical protein VLN90_04655, partial [Thioalkalivibrio sp.]|nr:hypothetical protein [Thioalkalivibrio sp.]
WDRYRNMILFHGVQRASVRWYVMRVEQFIRAFPGRRRAELESDDISGYPSRMGEKPTFCLGSSGRRLPDGLGHS